MSEHIEIEKYKERKTVPIIEMTASALKGDIQQCLDAGMNSHLSKSVDMKQLLNIFSETKQISKELG